MWPSNTLAGRDCAQRQNENDSSCTGGLVRHLLQLLLMSLCMQTHDRLRLEEGRTSPSGDPAQNSQTPSNEISRLSLGHKKGGPSADQRRGRGYWREDSGTRDRSRSSVVSLPDTDLREREPDHRSQLKNDLFTKGWDWDDALEQQGEPTSTDLSFRSNDEISEYIDPLTDAQECLLKDGETARTDPNCSLYDSMHWRTQLLQMRDSSTDAQFF